MATIINGRLYDWDSVGIKMKGFDDVDIKEISYSRKHDMEGRPGKKGQYKGVGYGAKTNSVKLTLYREDYNRLCSILRQKGYDEFSKAELSLISVSYADNGQGTTSDEMYNVRFNEEEFKNAENDKSTEVSLNGIARGGIKVNGMW